MATTIRSVLNITVESLHWTELQIKDKFESETVGSRWLVDVFTFCSIFRENQFHALDPDIHISSIGMGLMAFLSRK